MRLIETRSHDSASVRQFIFDLVSYITGYSYMSIQYLCERVENSEKSSEALKIQNDESM
jgi:hypothetical protein